MIGRLRGALAALLAVATLGSACAPSAPAGGGAAVGAEQPQAQAPRGPKNLAIGILREPQGLNEIINFGLTTSGNKQPLLIAHNYLAVRSADQTWIPQLAAELISIERGTWRVNPDGTMDTTWKIRPNVKWHDGTPFTADDLLFSLTVYKDPDIPNNIGNILRAMESAQVVDPQTFAIHWSRIFVTANTAQGLIPMPRHLMEQQYRTDKTNVPNNPILGNQFVGLGPYKLVSWESGVSMNLTRFDDYFLGRPPLDTVTVKFVPDQNVMIASVLAESIDVLLPLGVDLDAVTDIKRRWEGTGNQAFVADTGALRYIMIQHRPDYGRPANGLTNRAVRQAFSHATERATVSEVSQGGFAPAADSWFSPNSALYAEVRASIPQYPYDLARARQLLSQAGWNQATDGELTNAANGDRFEIEIRSSSGVGADRMLNTIADGWKAVGAQVNLNIVPAALSSDPEYRVTFPGAQVTGNIFDMFFTDVLYSKNIAGPENRWGGPNRSAYSNAAADTFSEKLAVTIDPAERIALHKGMVAQVMGDAALVPLFFEQGAVLALKGITGIRGSAENMNTWNMFEWNRD
ncbi:MAG: hypothetical protein HW416_1472 [Chloroflexi bacterium]|nr:hypothetical protein [Chloroflexota bacterium]